MENLPTTVTNSKGESLTVHPHDKTEHTEIEVKGTKGKTATIALTRLQLHSLGEAIKKQFHAMDSKKLAEEEPAPVKTAQTIE